MKECKTKLHTTVKILGVYKGAPSIALCKKGFIIKKTVNNPPAALTQTVAYINTFGSYWLLSLTPHSFSFRASVSSLENREGGPVRHRDISRYCVTGVGCSKKLLQ